MLWITPLRALARDLEKALLAPLEALDCAWRVEQRTGDTYRDALKEASSMGLTSSAPTSLYSRVIDSYPFHPDLRELVGKFKENDGFQQTRGVIRLMQMVVSNLWNNGGAERGDLIHPYDIDLNNDELASEVRTINPALSEAVAHDIAHVGDAEVEEIDRVNGNTDASDAARLILVASLSTTPGAIHGLREYQLVDCLQKPWRDLSTFKANVLDKLATRAWYLHNSADGRLFFKNQQNLAAKLRSTALSLHGETVDRMLRDHLESYFSTSLKDCYQVVKVLPPLDEVQVDQEKTTLVIVRPGGQANQLPISVDWQAWWTQQQYKNRVLFLTGSRDTFQKVLDSARQNRALQSIEDELRSENTATDDPQWRALDALRDRVGLQFTAALKEAFDQIVYPSINAALRATGVDLAFAGNQSGEATIRKTLEGAQKFTTKIDDEGFRSKAEARLFGSAETKAVLWSDFKRNAAVHTAWPLHKLSALDDLKADCLRKGLWREEGNHIRRGPFPPPRPEVAIRELSLENDGDGITYLKIEPLHASSVVYETGSADPTRASTPVPTPTRFEAKGLRYRFLAFDPAGTIDSEVRDWSPKLRLQHQLHNRGDHFEVELKVLPKASGIAIRYTTNGTSPTSAGFAVYDGVFRVPPNCRIVCALAVGSDYDLQSEIGRISIPQTGGDTPPPVDLKLPSKWAQQTKLDDSGAVWEFLERFEKAPGVTASDIGITADSADGQQNLEYSGALEGGYDAASLKALAGKLQEIVGGGSLRMTIGSMTFPSGQSMLDWLKASNMSFNASRVVQ